MIDIFDLGPPQAWHEAAACRDLDPAIFADPSREEEAKGHCVTCPVLEECAIAGLMRAVKGNDFDMVTGMMTQEERAAKVARIGLNMSEIEQSIIP